MIRSSRSLGDRFSLWLLLAMLLLLLQACGGGTDDATTAAEGSDGDEGVEASTDGTEDHEAVAAGDRDEITLYFPGASGLLYPEPRRVELPEEAVQRARVVLDEYLAGPRSDALARPFPEDVHLGGVYLSSLVGDEQVAIVDLVSAESPDPPPSGSRVERQRVYGVVHSALDNVGSLRGVVLLWNGRQRPAFAGHVDTGHVLVRDPSLIASSP